MGAVTAVNLFFEEPRKTLAVICYQPKINREKRSDSDSGPWSVHSGMAVKLKYFHIGVFLNDRIAGLRKGPKSNHWSKTVKLHL